MSDNLALTPRELEILQHAFHCFANPEHLKIDTDKLAQRCRMSNVKSASNAWNSIKKKLIGAANGGVEVAATNGDATAPPTKVTPKKRATAKDKTPEEAEGGDLADTEKTPGASSPASKKKQARKPKAAINGAEFPAKNENDEADPAVDTESTTTVTPQKKKRVRAPPKPKDPNAPPAKRGKKADKSDSTGKSAEPNPTTIAIASANAVVEALLNKNGSIIGDGPIKKEDGVDEDDEDHMIAEDAENCLNADAHAHGVDTAV